MLDSPREQILPWLGGRWPLGISTWPALFVGSTSRARENQFKTDSALRGGFQDLTGLPSENIISSPQLLVMGYALRPLTRT